MSDTYYTGEFVLQRGGDKVAIARIGKKPRIFPLSEFEKHVIMWDDLFAEIPEDPLLIERLVCELCDSGI